MTDSGPNPYAPGEPGQPAYEQYPSTQPIPPQYPTGQPAGQPWPAQPQQPASPGGPVPPQYAGYPPYPMPQPPRRKRKALWIVSGTVALLIMIIIIAVAATASGNGKVGVNAGAPAATHSPIFNGSQTQPPTENPTTPSDDSTQTQGLAAGDTIEVTSDDGSVEHVTVNSIKFATTGCGGSFTKPDADKKYAVIDVTYEGLSGPTNSYNPFDWTIRTTAGDEYAYGDAFDECSGDLQSSNSLHGKVHGKVYVSVPKSITHGLIEYAADFGSGASWKF